MVMSGKNRNQQPGVANAPSLPSSPSSVHLLSPTNPPRPAQPSGLQGFLLKPARWFSRAPSAAKQPAGGESRPARHSSSSRPMISKPTHARPILLQVPGGGLSISQSVLDLPLPAIPDIEYDSGDLTVASRRTWSRSVDDLASFASGGNYSPKTKNLDAAAKIEEYRNHQPVSSKQPPPLPPIPFPSASPSIPTLAPSPSLNGPTSSGPSPEFKVIVQDSPSQEEPSRAHVRAKSHGAHNGVARAKLPAFIPPSPPRRPSADSQDYRARLSSEKHAGGGLGALAMRPFHMAGMAGNKMPASSPAPEQPIPTPIPNGFKPTAATDATPPTSTTRNSQIIHCSGLVSRFTLTSKFNSQGLAVEKNWKPLKAQLQGTKLYFFKTPTDRVVDIRELFLTGPTPIVPEVDRKSMVDTEHLEGALRGGDRMTEDGKRKRAYWGRARHVDLIVLDETIQSGTSDALIHELIFATTFQPVDAASNGKQVSDLPLSEIEVGRWQQYAKAVLLCLPRCMGRSAFESEVIRDLSSFKRGATDAEKSSHRDRLKWLVREYTVLHGEAEQKNDWRVMLEEYDAASEPSSSSTSGTIVPSISTAQMGSASTSSNLQTKPTMQRGLSGESIGRSKLGALLSDEGLSRDTFSRIEMRKIAESLSNFQRSQLEAAVHASDFLSPGEPGDAISAVSGTEEKPHWLTRLVVEMVLDQVGRADKTREDPTQPNGTPRINSPTYVRASMASRWVQIGERCRLAGDECSWRAIMAGVCCIPVARLEKVWKRVDIPERKTVLDWVTGEKTVGKNPISPWGGDVRQKVADQMIHVQHAADQHKVQPMLQALSLIDPVLKAWSACQGASTLPPTASSEVAALVQYWGLRLQDPAPRITSISQTLPLSFAVESRRRCHFQPYFWRVQTGHPAPQCLVPFLFPESMPTVSLIDRDVLIRMRKESLLDPNLNNVELNEADARRVIERPRTTLADHGSRRRDLTEPDLDEMLIPCFNGELVLKLPLTNPKSRPVSLVDSRPPSTFSRPPSTISEDYRQPSRGDSIRLSPAMRMERKGSQARRSRRSSLPSISQRNSLVVPEPQSGGDATTRVTIKSGTLDRLVAVLVCGLEGVGIVHSDDNGEGPLRDGRSKTFKVDRVEFAQVWWCSFRSFVTPIVLFELLRKRFILAAQPTSSPSQSITTLFTSGKGSETSRSRQICIDVLATLTDWLTSGGGAQDVLDDSELYQAMRSFLAESRERDPVEVTGAREILLELFVRTTSRPSIDPTVARERDDAGASHRQFGTKPPDMNEVNAADLVDNLDSIACTVFRGVTEAHMFEMVDILEAQTADRTGWFLPRDLSTPHDDTLLIQDMYTYLQAVEPSPFIYDGAHHDHVFKLLNPSLRGVVRAHNSIREWTISRIADPTLSTATRLLRFELIVDALELCWDRANSNDPEASKNQDSQPSVRSFVTTVLASAILSPESRMYARTWHEVAAKRNTSLADVVNLLGPIKAKHDGTRPLTVDLAWIMERMMEVITLPDVLESDDSHGVINLDKRRYLHNLVVNAAGLMPRSKRATEAERHDMERLTNITRESQNVSCDLRSIREAAQRELNHLSFPQAGKRVVRPFYQLVALQQEKAKRDKYLRDRLLKEKKVEQLRTDKRASFLNRAMQPTKPPTAGQKHLRQKKSMSGIHNFFRPLSVAFGASTDRLNVMEGPRRTAEELDFPVNVSRAFSTLNLVGAGVRTFINDERPYTLQLDTDDGGHFLLQTLSLSDRDRWLSTLKKVAETSALKRLTYMGGNVLPQHTEMADFHGGAAADPSGIFGHDILSVLQKESPTGDYNPGALPRVVKMCIEEVEKRGLSEVGIYRIAGSKTVCSALRAEFTKGGPIDLSLDGAYPDIHVIGDLLRQWFRELPETIFTAKLYDSFLDTMKLQEYDERTTRLRHLIWQLPSPNFDALQALFEHLDHVVDFEDQNQMSPDSVALVFNPSLCKTSLTAFGHMKFTLALVKNCIIHYHYLFSQTEPEADAEHDESQRTVDDRSSDSPSPSPEIATNGVFPNPTRFTGLEPSGTESSFMTMGSDEDSL